MKERLKKFISYLDIPVSKFEKNCGMSNGYVKNITRSISSDKLAGIVAAYPQLNPSWLMMGVGDMLLPSEVPTFGFASVSGDNNGNINSGSGTQVVSPPHDSEEVRRLRERVHELELENARMQGMIDILKAK